MINNIISKYGIIPCSRIVKNSQYIGKTIAKKIVNQEAVEIGDVRQIFADVVGKKRAAKIVIDSDKDVFIKYANENLGLSESYAEMYYQHSLSAALPVGQGKKPLLCLRLKDASPDEIVNFSAHELEHVQFQNFSIIAWLGKMLKNTKIARQYTSKYITPNAELLNEKTCEMQEYLISDIGNFGCCAIGLSECEKGIHGLLRQTECSSLEELHKSIKSFLVDSEIIDKTNKKQSKTVLKSLAVMLREEARAYKAGGTSEAYLYQLLGTNETQNATKSELASMLYEEASKVVIKEFKNL